MSCDRCKDIHKAQMEGRTQTECKCNCHNHFYTGTTTSATDLTLTGNDVFTTFTASTAGTTDIPANTFTMGANECNCDGSVMHNCNCLVMAVHVPDNWCG